MNVKIITIKGEYARLRNAVSIIVEPASHQKSPLLRVSISHSNDRIIHHGAFRRSRRSSLQELLPGQRAEHDDF